MEDVKWISLAGFLLSCLVTYLWYMLDKVQNNLSDEEKKVKVLKRDQLTLDESVGDFKLHTEKEFILVKDRLLELELSTVSVSMGIVKTRLDKLEKANENCETITSVHKFRLDKLEGVKAPVKKTKKTKRKKS